MKPFFVWSFIWKWSKLCFVHVCCTVASASTTCVLPLHTTPPSPHPHLHPQSQLLAPSLIIPQSILLMTHRWPTLRWLMPYHKCTLPWHPWFQHHTQDIQPTYVAGWVCCWQTPCFILVLLRFICPRPLLFLTFADHHILSHLKFARGSLTAPWPPQSLTLYTSKALNCPVCGIGLCHLCKVFISACSCCIPSAASMMCSSWQRYWWRCGSSKAKVVQDIILTIVGGEDSTPHVLWEWLMDIQEGCIKWEGWGILCAVTNTARTSTISTPTLHLDDANADTTPQQHCHHIPMTLISHPDNTNIMSWQHQHCILTTPTLCPDNTDTIAIPTIVEICSYLNIYKPHLLLLWSACRNLLI